MPDKTNVLIIGGGPVGLTLSAQLGALNIENILVNKDTCTSTHPKCNLANARSMEHFRRLGISTELRKTGLPSDHPQDVVYFTRFCEPEIARIPIESSAKAMEESRIADPIWPTPEPPYRVSQIYIEDVLKRHAEKYETSSIRFGWELLDFTEENELITATVKNIETEEIKCIEADWLVGCDGGNGIVRPKLGIEYEGAGKANRSFMGGTMLATYYSSQDLAKVLERHKPGHMLWSYNNDFVSATIRINGKDTFLTHIQIPSNEEPKDWNPHEFIPLIAGEEIKLKVLSMSPWNAGFQLVASTFQKGRCLLAGDAAHLFTPTGGFGMNTGIDDAANLSWKLAGAIKGWGGPTLVSSYSKERQPIGVRNTSAARKIADIMGNLNIPDDLEGKDEEAQQARQVLVDGLKYLARNEYQTVGVQLGVHYNTSDIVSSDNNSSDPSDEITAYVPTPEPGARAPHIFINDGTSLYDLLGKQFTLLSFSGHEEDIKLLLEAASEYKVPVELLEIKDKEAAALYQKPLVLVRPDMHIAWCGDKAPKDSYALFDKIRGV